MSISVEHISKTFKNKRKSEEPAQVLKDVSLRWERESLYLCLGLPDVERQQH